jgi:hypothetical protein
MISYQEKMKINIINCDSLVKMVKELQCENKYIAYLNSCDFEIKQEDTEPLDGFNFPENFPFCCEHHKSILVIGNEHHKLFPNCCEWHKKLLKENWFDKKNYDYLPNKLLNTLTFTWHCIQKCSQNNNWFKEIADYISLTKHSYGQFPDGFGGPYGLNLYLENVNNYINIDNNLSILQKEKLTGFINKIPSKEKKLKKPI